MPRHHPPLTPHARAHAVTAMANSHSRWAVVMSRNASFVDQVGGWVGGCGGGGGRGATVLPGKGGGGRAARAFAPPRGPAEPVLRCCAQCVELDFQYPSEGIHRRWDAGYRITSCAATPDQAAFVLRCVPACVVAAARREGAAPNTRPAR